MTVASVDISSRRVVGIGEHQLSQLRMLTEWLLERVSTLFTEEQVVVLDRVRKEPLAAILEKRGEPLPAFLTQKEFTKRRFRP